MAEIERAIESGTYIAKLHIPAFAEVAGDWLKYKKPIARGNTVASYEGHLNNHLKPFFGNMPINRINFDAIEKYMDTARKKGRLAGSEHIKKKTMSEATLKKIMVTLGQVLKYATRKRYIEFNPVREIEKPKAKGRGRIDFLKPHEIRALLDNAEGAEYRMLFLMAVMTGMRQGELLGLMWTDIDWVNNQVCVRRSYNSYSFYEPKSEKSYRRIDLSPMVVSELKKWKLQCPASELDLVFPNEAGNPLDHNNMMERKFEPALRRAKLRKIRFHDLRHTYASLLIDQCEQPKYIQAQMGHASISITMDVYGHLMKDVNSEAPLKLEKAVFEKNGDILETLPEPEKEKALNKDAKCLNNHGAPERIRTSDLRIRSPALYPAELRARDILLIRYYLTFFFAAGQYPSANMGLLLQLLLQAFDGDIKHLLLCYLVIGIQF